MSEQQQGQLAQQHEEGESAGADLDLNDVAEAVGEPLPDLDLRPITADDTQAGTQDEPPDEDVRTVYSADREPGDPMPAVPQPS
jgi:hypothetical protein